MGYYCSKCKKYFISPFYCQHKYNPDAPVFDEEERMPIDKPYAYHKPSEDGLNKINKLREHFSEGDRLIREICPPSRQASIALTNNEQTAMWAIKAVVFNDPASEVS